MAVKIIALKCPQCGADLEIAQGKEVIYCTYCGTKIVLDNENARTYRYVDDADIERAETERMIQQHQIEMEHIREIKEEKDRRFRRKMIPILIGVIVVMVFIGHFNEDFFFPATTLSVLAVYIILFLIPNKNGGNASNNAYKAEIPDEIDNYESKNYETIESALRSVGFRNIKCIALHDLTTGFFKKPGRVDSITINGEEIFSSGASYPKESHIVIRYHSLE